MAFSNGLSQAGHVPTKVETTAKVHLEKTAAGFGIPRIDLVTKAVVPGLDDAKFHELADAAKKNCPVSKLLAAAEITLDAQLVK
jgi:osmotically inducible protein OsmC